MTLTSSSSESRVQAIAVLAGMVMAVIAMLAVATALLSVEGVSAKVLVAIWLWLLPALGAGAAIGWLAAALLRRLGRP